MDQELPSEDQRVTVEPLIFSTSLLPAPSSYFPVDPGTPVVITLHKEDDFVVHSVVGLVEMVEASEVTVSIIGGAAWEDDSLKVSLLMYDGLKTRRVPTDGYAWLDELHSTISIQLAETVRLSDQRASPRVEVKLPAILAVPDDGERTKELAAQIQNISVGGARAVFDHDDATFALRSSIFLRFSIDSELPLLVLARVVAAQRCDETKTMVRLQFESMDPSRRNRLHRFVEALRDHEGAAL